jgi:hypothetical protein
MVEGHQPSRFLQRSSQQYCHWLHFQKRNFFWKRVVEDSVACRVKRSQGLIGEYLQSESMSVREESVHRPRTSAPMMVPFMS